MKISRQVGTTNQVLNVFVQDATVSTGAGLANVVGSTVAISWWHNGQLTASTATASTSPSMGTFSTYGWAQISSTAALGWYQFGAPNGVFASGDVGLIHMYGAASMAPVPIEIELTATGWSNQASVSTQVSTAAVNIGSIAGSTTAASYLSGHAQRAVPVTISSSGNTISTVILTAVDGSAPSGTDSVYNSRLLVFSAPAGTKDQVCQITAYTGATKVANVSTLTAAPDAGVAVMV